MIQTPPAQGQVQKRGNMTVVTINEDSIEISGHAPEKVVCHGVSAIGQMTANYLEKCSVAEVRRNDGYLKISNIIQNSCSLFVLEAFVDGLRDIAKEYPGNIEFKFE